MYNIYIYDLVPKGVHENRTKGVENNPLCPVFMSDIYIYILYSKETKQQNVNNIIL